MTDPAIEYGSPIDARSPWQTVTRWIVVICVAVFVIDALLSMTGHARPLTRSDGLTIARRTADGQVVAVGQPVLTSVAYFSVDKGIVSGQVWRFFTYQFVHANLEHIVLNLFGLLMAGPLVESVMGRGRYLLFYLICGAAGPAAHVALSLLGVMHMDTITPLVGASASIYGVLVAAARIAPDETVMLAMPPVDMKLKHFALLMIGLSVLAVAWQWQNAGGHAAHLGGALAGWFLSRRFAAGAAGPASAPASPRT